MKRNLRQLVADLGEAYVAWVESLKVTIGAAQTRAAVAVNRELMSLYLLLGDQILAKQAEHGWGKSVVERLAADLQAAFPGVAGFSALQDIDSGWPVQDLLDRFEALWQAPTALRIDRDCISAYATRRQPRCELRVHREGKVRARR